VPLTCQVAKRPAQVRRETDQTRQQDRHAHRSQNCLVGRRKPHRVGNTQCFRMPFRQAPARNR